MKQSIKISIITATWNSGETLKETIKSLSAPKYANIEHIIIDGDSSDNTIEIARNSPVKNTKIISEKDSGIYDALNKGIKYASGDVIGLLHSDDTYANNNVLNDVFLEFNNQNVDAVYGDLIYVKKNDTKSTIRYWQSNIYNKNLLKIGWMPPHPSLFLRRKVYESLGGFNLNYKISSDYDLIIRVFKEIGENAIYIPKVFIKMKIGGASNKSIKNTLIKSKEDYLILKRNKVGGVTSLLLKNLLKLDQFFKKTKKYD